MTFSFPMMSDLPVSLSTHGWTWKCICRSGHASDGFWIGDDGQGNKWLLKLRGSFYAYREIVFSRLVQRLGWSCQSSCFVRLDSDAARILGREIGEIHAAHWFMDEHAHPPCSSDCALDELVGLQINSIEDVSNLNVKNIIDWPKSELAAYIFGGNEPPGKLFTASHEFVIIDSEQMFSTGPSPFGNSAPWMWRANRSFSESGHALAVTVCKEISSLPASFVEEVLAIPNGILIDLRWPIMPKLKASIEFARNYAR